jgi:hypothetical protein
MDQTALPSPIIISRTHDSGPNENRFAKPAMKADQAALVHTVKARAPSLSFGEERCSILNVVHVTRSSLPLPRTWALQRECVRVGCVVHVGACGGGWCLDSGPIHQRFWSETTPVSPVMMHVSSLGHVRPWPHLSGYPLK